MNRTVSLVATETRLTGGPGEQMMMKRTCVDRRFDRIEFRTLYLLIFENSRGIVDLVSLEWIICRILLRVHSNSLSEC